MVAVLLLLVALEVVVVVESVVDEDMVPVPCSRTACCS